MADNSVLPVSGGGTETFANDDIGGVKYWRTKISLGADGTAVDAVAGAGAATTGTQRVILASDDPAVTSLAIIDDWDESDRCKVNLVVGQSGVAAGSGGSGTNTLRTITATDSPEVTALQIIDDWDETDRCKVNLIVGQAGVAAGTGAAGATTQRVVAASDSPEVTALGATSDAATLTGNGSAIALLKAIRDRLTDAIVGDYEHVAASQTTQVLGATGGAGDYLTGLLIIPGTTSPGNVLLRDGSGGSDRTIFAGGASSVSNLVPFFVPFGARATSDWRVTTGANVTVFAVGNFT